MTVTDPLLAVDVVCNRFALFSKVKLLPASTVKAPFRLTSYPDGMSTTALLVTVRLMEAAPLTGGLRFEIAEANAAPKRSSGNKPKFNLRKTRKRR